MRHLLSTIRCTSGGCDVLFSNATKWSANFWLWNKPYHFVDPARRRATKELTEEWI